MNTNRPSIFIGSSAEGLAVAEAVQLNLDRDCQVTIWHQGVFGLSLGPLESLTSTINRFDYAILVVTPDDLVLSREEAKPSPRDNVLLELGMFIGALGRNRVFFVIDRTKEIKLPSDLAGIQPATYEPHTDGNLQAALGPVCTQIKTAVRELGVRSRSELTGIIEPNEHFAIVADLLGDPANQFIIQMLGDSCAFERRMGIFSHGEPYEWFNKRGNGGVGGFDIDKMCKQLPDADLIKQDLRNKVTLTQRGKLYASWLIKNGRKADYFWSMQGEWGERHNDWNLSTRELFIQRAYPPKVVPVESKAADKP